MTVSYTHLDVYKRQVRVRFADRKAWAAGRFKPLWGETPPYELYLAARQRFCK